MRSASERFGAAVATVLGMGPGRSSIAAQRARFIASVEKQGIHLAWWVPAAACVVALMASLSWLTGRDVLVAQFRGARVAEQQVLEPPGSSVEALKLSDGSNVKLRPSARLKVEKLAPGNVVLELQRGRMEAEVSKHAAQHWAIVAGPYTVRVVGTRFSVDWDRDGSSLLVGVSEGRVVVTGGSTGERGVVLGAGQRFASAAESPPAALPLASAAGDSEPSLPRVDAPAAPTAPSVPAPGPTWAALAANSKYKEALALAKKAGFDELVRTLRESELLLLANTARYAGDAERAQHALLALRQRFAGGAAAGLSAFYLARVAEDQRGDLGDAARWLRTYLNEVPQGELAASARASLLGIMLRTGDTAGAHRAAQSYLDHHPQGPHAQDARAVLARPR